MAKCKARAVAWRRPEAERSRRRDRALILWVGMPIALASAVYFGALFVFVLSGWKIAYGFVLSFAFFALLARKLERL